jgi:hypothetical protein
MSKSVTWYSPDVGFGGAPCAFATGLRNRISTMLPHLVIPGKRATLMLLILMRRNPQRLQSPRRSCNQNFHSFIDCPTQDLLVLFRTV